MFDYEKELEIGKWFKEEEGLPSSKTKEIIDPDDFRFIIIHKVIDALKRACVYYSPQSKEYFDQLVVTVVDNEEVNAMAGLGGCITVYTGTVDFYMEKFNDFRKVEAVVSCELIGVMA